ncbi:hypothetical protein VTO73DRAFT_1511 [Trametes versicolor]
MLLNWHPTARSTARSSAKTSVKSCCDRAVRSLLAILSLISEDGPPPMPSPARFTRPAPFLVVHPWMIAGARWAGAPWRNSAGWGRFLTAGEHGAPGGWVQALARTPLRRQTFRSAFLAFRMAGRSVLPGSLVRIRFFTSTAPAPHLPLTHAFVAGLVPLYAFVHLDPDPCCSVSRPPNCLFAIHSFPSPPLASPHIPLCPSYYYAGAPACIKSHRSNAPVFILRIPLSPPLFRPCCSHASQFPQCIRTLHIPPSH